jgi:transcription-repair coupling factor (superfamily II helicase)
VDDTQVDLQLTAFIPAEWINDNDEKVAAYRAAAQCGSKAALLELAAGWTDRFGPIPGPVISLLRLLELKLLAKRCGVSRIKPEKPNILLETPMEEPAFRLLRQGLPTHLHGRLVYQGGGTGTAKIVARGLGALPADKQVEELMEWLEKMAAQIPSPDGTTEEDRADGQGNQTEVPLLVV